MSSSIAKEVTKLCEKLTASPKRVDENQMKFAVVLAKHISEDVEKRDVKSYVKSEDRIVDDILFTMLRRFINDDGVDIYDCAAEYLPHLLAHDSAPRMQFVRKLLDEYDII